MEMETCLLIDRGGYNVEWFREDEDGTGWVAHWYGTEAACRERAKHAPRESWWTPLTGDGGGGSSDAATATGMYDR